MSTLKKNLLAVGDTTYAYFFLFLFFFPFSSLFLFLFSLLSSCLCSIFATSPGCSTLPQQFSHSTFLRVCNCGCAPSPGCSTLPQQCSHSTSLRFCNCGCATSPGCSTLPQQALHFRLVGGYFVHFQSAQVYFQLLNSLPSKYQSMFSKYKVRKYALLHLCTLVLWYFEGNEFKSWKYTCALWKWTK